MWYTLWFQVHFMWCELNEKGKFFRKAGDWSATPSLRSMAITWNDELRWEECQMQLRIVNPFFLLQRSWRSVSWWCFGSGTLYTFVRPLCAAKIVFLPRMPGTVDIPRTWGSSGPSYVPGRRRRRFLLLPSCKHVAPSAGCMEQQKD